jgi:two-component system sensor histidine kinase HydH
MDIKISLSRSFAYTILIFLITFMYFLATYLISTYLNALIGYKSFIFSFLAASITALAFIPLKDILQTFIDKYFFKKTINEIEQENLLLRQEVTQSDRMKSIAILASGMAHEIKNPLTPIKTFSEQLPSRLDDKEFLLKFSKIINKEVDRIDSLVQELLSFAKPSLPELKQTNIHQLIEQTLELLNNEIIRHKINLNTSFENKNIFIHIDPQQIKQAFLNIFLNAIDAMPNGGTLTINTSIITSEAKQSLIIEISDTGCGIDPKDLSHIFDPFFSKKDHGTGLGLSITHEIIKNHNGKILAESKLGKGTTFRIELPV